MKGVGRVVALAATLAWSNLYAAGAESCPPLLDHEFRLLSETEAVNLCAYMHGKVILVVNTASKCAYTPQYDGLEKLYADYRDRGFVVAGFPSADFAGQEYSGEAEIREFCRLTYNVKFPLFEKSRVRGSEAHPFYQQLAAQGGQAPRWNFHKYLIDREGRVVESFPSQVEPDDPRLVSRIEDLL